MKILHYIFVMICSLTFGQVTIKINQIPTNTPQNAAIYMPSSANTWNAAGSVLQNSGNGQYQIIIPESSGTVSYKFTRGTWASVEGSATGNYLPNRSFTFNGTPQTLNLTIQSWEDLSTTASTAASNVSILSTSFFMPQLNKNRKIWLYLPPDYATSTKNYPVLYMHDGQNLFDNATSFSGEWQVDETLNTLFQQGNYGAIVVGIDNGGADRLNEYSPWNNPSYGGGQGDLFAQFVALTLKPYIDANYRTKPAAEFTAVLGSSMGGLISSYISAKYPSIFQKVGNFSPAFWFAKTPLLNYINTNNQNYSNSRMYFVAGTTEDADMVPDSNEIKNAFQSKLLSTSNTITKYDSYGTHSENYWRGEFAAAYLWLFQNVNLVVDENQITKPIIYKTSNNEIFVDGFSELQTIYIYSINGVLIHKMDLQNGLNDLNRNLPKGIYFLKTDNYTYKILF